MRLFIVLSIILSSILAYAGDKTTDIFTLDHQMTGMCKKRITEIMRFEKGVSKIDISIPDNTISITFDPQKTDTDIIIKSFKKIGFNAFLINPKETKREEETYPVEEKFLNQEQISECECCSICSGEYVCCYNSVNV